MPTGQKQQLCDGKTVENKCKIILTTGKRPLERPRRRRVDNIRMGLEEIGINAGNSVDSTQYRDYWRALVIAALNFRVT